MVQQIQAGGELRPFLFNYGALKRFCADTKRSLADINLDKLDFAEIESMAFRGFEAGAKADNIDFPVGQKDMEEWLNEDFGLIETISKAVAASFDTSKKNQVIPKSKMRIKAKK